MITDHPFFIDYSVTTDGKVWSKYRVKLRIDGSRLPIKGRWLKPAMHKSGHLHVVLRQDGQSYTKKIHHLVLETFIGLRPEGLECRHLNGNPADNRLENLQWGTSHENHQDSIEHGTVPKGEKHHNTK